MSVRAARKRFRECCILLGYNFIPKHGTNERLNVQVLVRNNVLYSKARKSLRKRVYRYHADVDAFILERRGASKRKTEVIK